MDQPLPIQSIQYISVKNYHLIYMLNVKLITKCYYTRLLFGNNSNPSKFCYSFRDFFKPRIKDIVILELNVRVEILSFCQIATI